MVGDVVLVFSCIKLPLAVVVLWLLYIEKIKTSPVWCGGGGGVGG